MTGIYDIVSEEFAEYARLYVDVFNAEPWNDEWTEDTALRRLQDIYSSPGFVGCKYLDDGTVKAAVFGNCEQWYKGMHYNLKEMFVSTELQGRGVGSRLLEHLEARLKDLNVNAIYLFTSKGNLTDRFYRKNGFNEFESMAMMGKSI